MSKERKRKELKMTRRKISWVIKNASGSMATKFE